MAILCTTTSIAADSLSMNDCQDSAVIVIYLCMTEFNVPSHQWPTWELRLDLFERVSRWEEINGSFKAIYSLQTFLIQQVRIWGGKKNSGVTWASWHLRSLATRLFVQQLVQTDIKMLLTIAEFLELSDRGQGWESHFSVLGEFTLADLGARELLVQSLLKWGQLTANHLLNYNKEEIEDG